MDTKEQIEMAIETDNNKSTYQSEQKEDFDAQVIKPLIEDSSGKIITILSVSYLKKYALTVCMMSLLFTSFWLMYKILFHINKCTLNIGRTFNSIAYGIYFTYWEYMAFFAFLYISLKLINIKKTKKLYLSLMLICISTATINITFFGLIPDYPIIGLCVFMLGSMLTVWLLLFYLGSWDFLWLLMPQLATAAAALPLGFVCLKVLYNPKFIKNNAQLFSILLPLFVFCTETACMKLFKFLADFPLYKKLWCGLIETATDCEENRNKKIVDVLNEEYVFMFVGSLIIIVEALRVSGLIALKNNGYELTISCALSIILEVIFRNNLYYEAFHRIKNCDYNHNAMHIVKQMHIGIKYQCEYVPYINVILINLFVFGPSEDCWSRTINENISLRNGYWWMIAVMICVEIMSDASSEFVKFFGRKYGLFAGKNDTDDIARKVIHIRLSQKNMLAAFIYCFSWSYIIIQAELY